MTSPIGWALGDARIPEDEYDPYGYPMRIGRHRLPLDAESGHLATERDRRDGRTRAAETKRRKERELVEVAVPAILADLLSSLPNLLHVVRLCDHCRSQHFLPSPVFPGNPCLQLQCQCWCSEGTGQ